MFKKRFKLAVKELKNKHGITPAATPAQVKHVVISVKESESMKALQAKLAQIGGVSQRIDENQDKLSADVQRLGAEIEGAFKAIRSRLNEREKALMAALEEATKTQMEALKAQQANVEQFADSAKQALSEQNRMILDAALDSGKRETKIAQIAEDTLKGIRDEDLAVTARELRFIVELEAANKVCVYRIYTRLCLSPAVSTSTRLASLRASRTLPI